MIDINKKLEKIEKNCLDIAKKELNTLKDENNQVLDEKILEKVNSYKEELSKKYDIELNKIKREYNRNLFDYERTEKKKINDFKQTLINNIENKIKSEFEDFTSSQEYKEYLFKAIKKSIQKGKSNDCTVFVTERDYNKYEEEIARNFNINVGKIDNSNIGGCVLININDKISVDNTLKTNIEEKVKTISF